MQNHRNVLGGVLRSLVGDKGGQFKRSGGQVDGAAGHSGGRAEEGRRRGRPATPGSLGPAARLDAGSRARESGQTRAALTPTESQRWCKEENRLSISI